MSPLVNDRVVSLMVRTANQREPMDNR